MRGMPHANKRFKRARVELPDLAEVPARGIALRSASDWATFSKGGTQWPTLANAHTASTTQQCSTHAMAAGVKANVTAHSTDGSTTPHPALPGSRKGWQ